MEEITLSVPTTFTDDTRAAGASGRRKDEHGNSPTGLDQLARRFLAAARSRDRLALTDKIRLRRQENFERTLKRLVKTVAGEAAGAVPERRARAEVRTRVYAGMVVLARLAAQDQRRTARRARRALRCALAAAAIGATGVAFTLVANGWIPGATDLFR